MDQSKPNQLLSSVNNAIRILRAFSMDQPQKGVRELGSELGIGKSSVQRILATLSSHGFVRKNKETNKYELGLSVLELSSIFLEHIDLHQEALPVVTKLAHTHKETSHLAVLEDSDVVYLCKVESSHSLELRSHSGHHNHIHCTSSGKLLLAHSDRHLVDKVMSDNLMKFTSTTITNQEALQNELNKILKQGYSVSKGEYRKDVTSVSAPIRDHSGKVIAAVNLVGPSDRFTNPRIQYFARELIRAGELISEKLGYWKR
ncbi:IclR family transcriptional regulator [Oceanobacillus piezotolerans]|uniref:Glycerol operon regulatory protein n=1 Tax=Oceanobacillus piezotolerans TaxID=2448030 RepID=A0A498D4E0_9BACI|nr:IclR family transcriptional regulator [Oceanobacillus piezotolerans]RLL43745.1 IclR family transcriptional regulator [Oceanobacillus piezotolerans]